MLQPFLRVCLIPGIEFEEEVEEMKSLQQRYNVMLLNDPYPEGVIVLLIVSENLYTRHNKRDLLGGPSCDELEIGVVWRAPGGLCLLLCESALKLAWSDVMNSLETNLFQLTNRTWRLSYKKEGVFIM